MWSGESVQYSTVQYSTVQQEHHEENIALQAMGLGPYPFIGMLTLTVLMKNLSNG